MFDNFLGKSPKWYKMTILSFLIFNIFSFFVLGPQITSWLIIGVLGRSLEYVLQFVSQYVRCMFL